MTVYHFPSDVDCQVPCPSPLRCNWPANDICYQLFPADFLLSFLLHAAARFFNMQSFQSNWSWTWRKIIKIFFTNFVSMGSCEQAYGWSCVWTTLNTFWKVLLPEPAAAPGQGATSTNLPENLAQSSPTVVNPILSLNSGREGSRKICMSYITTKV